MYAMNNGNNLASLIGQLCIGHSGLASISSRSSSGSIISDNSSISSINSNSISSSSNRSTRSGSNASSGSVNICTGDSWWVRLYMTWPIQGHTSNIKIITSPLGMGSWLVVLLLIVRYFFYCMASDQFKKITMMVPGSSLVISSDTSQRSQKLYIITQKNIKLLQKAIVTQYHDNWHYDNFANMLTCL